MTCRSNAPDPTLNLGAPITGHQGNVRLRSTQSSGTVDEEQSQEIPAETHEGNEAYRDEPDFPFALFAFLNMALAADNRLPWAPSALHWFAPAAISARRGACQSVRGSPTKSLCCQNVPKAQGVRPTFQTAFFKTTFASSSPPTPANQSGLCGVMFGLQK